MWHGERLFHGYGMVPLQGACGPLRSQPVLMFGMSPGCLAAGGDVPKPPRTQGGRRGAWGERTGGVVTGSLYGTLLPALKG